MSEHNNPITHIAADATNAVEYKIKGGTAHIAGVGSKDLSRSALEVVAQGLATSTQAMLPAVGKALTSGLATTLATNVGFGAIVGTSVLIHDVLSGGSNVKPTKKDSNITR